MTFVLVDLKVCNTSRKENTNIKTTMELIKWASGNSIEFEKEKIKRKMDQSLPMLTVERQMEKVTITIQLSWWMLVRHLPAGQ